MKKMILVFVLLSNLVFAVETLNTSEYLLLIEDEGIRWFVDELCMSYDLPIEVVVRLMFVESSIGEDLHRKEPTGVYSVGYMQLLSSNFEWFEEKFYDAENVYGEFDPYNDYINIYVGLKYLCYLRDMFGDLETALIAYNSGSGNVRRNTFPMSSVDYSVFIMTGIAHPDSHLVNRQRELQTLLNQLSPYDVCLVYAGWGY